MLNLEEIRSEIDQIDQKMVALYEERMKLAEQVAKYKLSTGKQVLDKEREQQKLESLALLTKTEFGKQSVTELFEQIMSVSRKKQYQMIAATRTKEMLPFIPMDHIFTYGAKVVYQGVEGAYSQKALLEFFQNKVTSSSVETWRDAMEAIKNKQADYAVLPIENSTAGIVSENFDLLLEYEHCIVAEQIIRIDHCLMAHPESDLSQITDIYSHPQALMQCSKYLEEHKGWEKHSTKNTAISARKVMEIGSTKNAAIAGKITADLYGLKILGEAIQNDKENFTRFIIVTGEKVFQRDAQKISICFELEHKSGSLYHALSHFIFNNISMNKIESRPVSGKNWEYQFFIDVEGNLMDSGMQNALIGLMQETKSLKILGNYPVHEERV